MMQKTRRNRTLAQAGFEYLALLYHSVVRDIRAQTGNATLGILATASRMLVMVLVFYAMYELMGMRAAALRGDFFIFLLSGIFLFFIHNSAVSVTVSRGNAVSGMMLHAPVTTFLMIASGAISSLYTNLMAAAIILFFVLTYRDGAYIDDPVGMIAPVLLTWTTGIAIGLVMLVFKPFFPRLSQVLSLIYRRLNLISSGKFFVANLIPGKMLIYFSWNPLFHCIDQARGAAFVNYFPRNTTLDYPLRFLFVGLVIGLLAEFWHRRNVSSSTGKR